jgi:hypothetical protein
LFTARRKALKVFVVSGLAYWLIERPYHLFHDDYWDDDSLWNRIYFAIDLSRDLAWLNGEGFEVCAGPAHSCQWDIVVNPAKELAAVKAWNEANPE